MGNGAIYWYPDVTKNTLESILLGERWSDLAYETNFAVSTSETASGGIVATVERPSITVHAVWEKLSISGNLNKYRQFRALEAHVARGGLFAIADDVEKLFLTSSTKDVLERGESGTQTSGNCFDTWGTFDINADDALFLLSDAPESKGELVLSDTTTYPTTSPHLLQFDSSIVNSYAARVSIRSEYFFPFLRRSPDSDGTIIFSERGRLFTIEITAKMDLEALFVCCAAGHGSFKGTSVSNLPTADQYYLDERGPYG